MISEMYEDEIYLAFESLSFLEINGKTIATTFKIASQYDTKLIKLLEGLGGTYCTGKYIFL